MYCHYVNVNYIRGCIGLFRILDSKGLDISTKINSRRKKEKPEREEEKPDESVNISTKKQNKKKKDTNATLKAGRKMF